MSSTKPQIEELWELADFESLASLQFQPEDQGAKHILNEARAALRLLNSPTLSEKAIGRKLNESERYKTVTILHSSLPHHPGGYSNRAQGLLQGLSKVGVELTGYTRPGFYRERVNKTATAPLPVDTVENNITYHHLVDRVPGVDEVNFSIWNPASRYIVKFSLLKTKYRPCQIDIFNRITSYHRS